MNFLLIALSYCIWHIFGIFPAGILKAEASVLITETPSHTSIHPPAQPHEPHPGLWKREGCFKAEIWQRVTSELFYASVTRGLRGKNSGAWLKLLSFSLNESDCEFWLIELHSFCLFPPSWGSELDSVQVFFVFFPQRASTLVSLPISRTCWDIACDVTSRSE